MPLCALISPLLQGTLCQRLDVSGSLHPHVLHVTGCSLYREEGDDFSSFPDISEGLDNLIFSSLRTVSSYNELLETIKSKRYTMARIRRIILSAFLGVDNSFFLKEPPYARVLGFSKEGVKFLPKNSIKPLVTTVAEINNLNEFAEKVFETEIKSNEIYALSLDKPEQYINDYKFKILKK